MDKVSLSDYWDMLEEHDWFHMMSDDGGVDRRGDANYRRLAKIAEQSKEHLAMLKAFHEHKWTGKIWGTEKAPKPGRPPLDR